MRDWLTSPRSWSDWGLRLNGWMNEFIDLFRAVSDTVDDLDTGVPASMAGVLQPGITNYGAGWEGANLIKVGRVVHLQGLVKATAAVPQWSPILVAPPGYRPAGRVMLLSQRSPNVTPVRLDVQPDGSVAPGSALAPGAYVNLTGLSFLASP